MKPGQQKLGAVSPLLKSWLPSHALSDQLQTEVPIRPMRCYFNLANGTEEIVDYDGIEVGGIEQARTQALKAIAELRQEDSDVASEWKNWQLEVSDSSGRVLFTISLALDSH